MNPTRATMAAFLGILVAAVAISACPQPPTPAPMPPDATDGAPFVLPDGSPLGTPCSAACEVLQNIGCPVEPDCVTVYAHVESAKEKRTPSGQLLTCMMVTVAQTKLDVRALGIGCP